MKNIGFTLLSLEIGSQPKYLSPINAKRNHNSNPVLYLLAQKPSNSSISADGDRHLELFKKIVLFMIG
jgi:hypothetical protein